MCKEPVASNERKEGEEEEGPLLVVCVYLSGEGGEKDV